MKGDMGKECMDISLFPHQVLYLDSTASCDLVVDGN